METFTCRLRRLSDYHRLQSPTQQERILQALLFIRTTHWFISVECRIQYGAGGASLADVDRGLCGSIHVRALCPMGIFGHTYASCVNMISTISPPVTANEHRPFQFLHAWMNGSKQPCQSWPRILQIYKMQTTEIAHVFIDTAVMFACTGALRRENTDFSWAVLDWIRIGRQPALLAACLHAIKNGR